MLFADATPSAGWPPWLTFLGQFKSYMILFAAAAAATLMATPLYILIAHRLGWVDRPWGRKRHERATATMGGLVIFGAVFAGAFIALSLDNRVGEMLRERRVEIYTLLACTTCMILLGIIDDRHAIAPRVKLLVQSVVAIAAIALGFRVQAITMPFVDSVPVPALVSYALSLLWIVGITNAVNLTDGLDGLAAGICFLAASVNALVAIWLGNYYMSAMMVLLAGALLGFLRYNFHPARVFLGDTGAMGLGMFLALSSLQSAQKSHTAVLILVPLFALGYPIFDTLLAVARRTLRGQPLFTSDRDHIHHRLLDRGRSPSMAAIQIY
ncbi:MAG TPA: MraY family glycosyltransferase, partial [Phycisphaerae bacterium]|nr:MraY family glycosyltransferase [Phycisphaerae bacterium]